MIDIDHWHATFHETGGSIFMRMTNDKAEGTALWFFSPMGSPDWIPARDPVRLEEEFGLPREVLE